MNTISKDLLKYGIIGVAIIVAGLVIAGGLRTVARQMILTRNNTTPIIFDKTGYGVDTYEQNREAEETFDFEAPEINVWKDGKLYTYTGEELSGEYYHMGQMLKITYINAEGNRKFHFFHHPDRWEGKKE